MESKVEFETEIEDQIVELEDKIKTCQKYGDWKVESALIQAQNQLSKTLELTKTLEVTA